MDGSFAGSPGRFGIVANSIPSMKPKPANPHKNLRKICDQLLKAGSKQIAGGSDILSEVLALDHFEDFQGHRASQRRAAIGGAMRARAQQIRVRRPDPKRANRETAAERFRHRNAVRQERIAAGDTFQDPLKTLIPAAAEMTALDGVHQQQQILLVAQLPQPQQILRCGGSDPALALDAFDENGGGGRAKSRRASLQDRCKARGGTR